MPKRGRKKATEQRKNLDQGQDAEQEKRLFMWVGVSCVMAVIVVAWIFNLKHQFKLNADSSGKNNFNWSQTKSELDKAMAQIKESLSQIKQIKDNAQTTAPELSEEQIKALKGKLLEEVGTSTAESIKK